MIKYDVYSLEGKVARSYDFNYEGTPVVNKNAIWAYIRCYENNQRQGNASTKGRSEIVGSNEKPWRQKGTGRARAGTKKSPIWRGGGAVFGPKPRDYRTKILRKVKRKAFDSAFFYKTEKEAIRLMDNFDWSQMDIKTFLKFLKAIESDSKKTLLITDGESSVTFIQNIPVLTFRDWKSVNCYDIISSQSIILNDNVMEDLMSRFSFFGEINE